MKKVIIISISNTKVEKLANVTREHFPKSEIISTTDSKIILSLVPDGNSPYMLITGQVLIGGEWGFKLIQQAKERNQHITSVLISRIKPDPSQADYVIETTEATDAGEAKLEMIIKEILKKLQ
jgi:hypothetical protein